MDEKIKKGLSEAVRLAEIGLTRSILRWKYRREDRSIPPESILNKDSEQIADRAHSLLSVAGKNAWSQLKEVYKKGEKRGGEEAEP